MRIVTISAAALALALGACGEEAAKKEAAPAAPAKLPAGEYEVTATVKSLVSTDNSPVPTFTKVNDIHIVRACVGADGLPEPKMLASHGDRCELSNPFVRNGRMNLQLNCTRSGQGAVNLTVDGRYTADGFTGSVETASMFSGPGDYRMVQDIRARRIGDQCPASAAG